MKSASHHHVARQHRTNRPGVEAVSITSNRQFPRHAHDNYGLGLFDAGAHRTWSSFGDVQSSAGDVITVNPEEMHDGVPVANAPRSWRMMYFDRDVIAEFIDEDSRRPLEFAKPILRDAALKMQLEALFRLMVSDGAERLDLDSALAQVLMTIRDRHSAEAPAPRGGGAAVNRALRLIDEQPHAAISLGDLAAAAGVSRFQLIRGFTKAVGVTPYAYQTQRRVRMAQRFIAGGCRLADAADMSGFSDQAHMTRAFVRQLGVTPARYRSALQ